MCAAGPLALCAEDLHHADGDSLRVLGQLVDATHDLPLTLVLACRPLPARDQLIAIAARPDVLAVDVVPMDRPGLADLIRRRWRTEPDDRAARSVVGDRRQPVSRGGAAGGTAAGGSGDSGRRPCPAESGDNGGGRRVPASVQIDGAHAAGAARRAGP